MFMGYWDCTLDGETGLISSIGVWEKYFRFVVVFNV